MRDEIVRRFGDRAEIEYVDTSDAAQNQRFAGLVAEIHDKDLLYPVTVIDGVIVYDGAVSYPVILRTVEAKLESIA